MEIFDLSVYSVTPDILSEKLDRAIRSGNVDQIELIRDDAFAHACARGEPTGNDFMSVFNEAECHCLGPGIDNRGQT